LSASSYFINILKSGFKLRSMWLNVTGVLFANELLKLKGSLKKSLKAIWIVKQNLLWIFSVASVRNGFICLLRTFQTKRLPCQKYKLPFTIFRGSL